MFEEEVREFPRSLLFLLGTILLVIGIFMVVGGVVTGSDLKSGGLIMIGPIPFFFYSDDPTLALAVFLLPLALALLIIFTLLRTVRAAPAE